MSQGISKEASSRIDLQENFACGRIGFRMLKKFKSDFCNYKRPALELPKNRFDERITIDAKRRIDAIYDALFRERLQV